MCQISFDRFPGCMCSLVNTLEVIYCFLSDTKILEFYFREILSVHGQFISVMT